VDKVERILFRLDNALVIEDMDLPGFRLHRLTGDLKGFWSVSVSGNWRIIFRFENGKAFDVEMTDYH
jgi:toxin HigB-1